MATLECAFCKKLDSWGDAGAISDCNLADGKPCQPCKQVQILNKEIARTKRLLDRLLSRRRVLCNRVNLSHDRMIQRFPAEISSYIFRLSLTEDSDPFPTEDRFLTTPFDLGSVCQAWRNIVWASPDLWTHIIIFLEPDYNFDSLKIARQWLRQSGQLPLSMFFFSNHFLYDAGDPIEGIDDFCSELSNFMQEYISRCRTLEFRCQPQLIPSFSGVAPMLERLAISSNEQLPGHNLISLRSLRPEGICISLEGYRLTSLDIDWGRVTKFKGRIYGYEFSELFQKAHRLEACELRGFPRYYNVDQRHPLLSQNIKQKSLTTLSLKPARQDVSPTAVLLNMVNLPSLIHLEMSDIRPSLLENFVRRSTCDLSSLTLQSINCSDSIELIDAFKAMLSLEELHISAENPCVYKFFIHLSNTCIPGKDIANWEIFLPYLRVLDIRFFVEIGFLWRHVASIFGTSHDISNPARRPIARFCVTYDWRISCPAPAQPVNVGGVESHLPSHYLEEDIMEHFLLIAESGVDLRLYDIHRQCDLLEEAIRYYGVPIPKWYNTCVPIVDMKSRYREMHEVNALDSHFDSDYSDETTSDSEDDDSYNDYGSESDISDKSYDCARGLPSYVTGETSELL